MSLDSPARLISNISSGLDKEMACSVGMLVG